MRGLPASRQARFEAGPAFARGGVADGDFERLSLADDDHQFPAAGDGRVEEVPLKHHVVLGAQRDDDGGELAPLAFVDGDGVGEAKFVEVAGLVSGSAAVVEADGPAPARRRCREIRPMSPLKTSLS